MERKRKEVQSRMAGGGAGGSRWGPLGHRRADPEAGTWLLLASFPPTPLPCHLPGKVTQS